MTRISMRHRRPRRATTHRYATDASTDVALVRHHSVLGHGQPRRYGCELGVTQVFDSLCFTRTHIDLRGHNARMSPITTESVSPKAKQKTDPETPTLYPVSITAILERWKSMAEARLGCRRSPAEPGDRAREALAAPKHAQALLRELADDESILLECIVKGVHRPLEWIKEHPHELPPHRRPIEGVPRCDWRIRSGPTDAVGKTVTVRDPVNLLSTVAGSIIPAWIAEFGVSADSCAPTKIARLSVHARKTLEMLWKLRATSEAQVCRVAKQAPTAYLQSGVDSPTTRLKYAERGIDELRRLGLVETRQAKGTWLTPDGCNEARRLFSPK